MNTFVMGVGYEGRVGWCVNNKTLDKNGYLGKYNILLGYEENI